MSQVRTMTPQEKQQGHVPCECGEFTHITRASVVAKLPPHYHGELCPRCNLWMASMSMVAAALA